MTDLTPLQQQQRQMIMMLTKKDVEPPQRDNSNARWDRPDQIRRISAWTNDKNDNFSDFNPYPYCYNDGDAETQRPRLASVNKSSSLTRNVPAPCDYQDQPAAAAAAIPTRSNSCAVAYAPPVRRCSSQYFVRQRPLPPVPPPKPNFLLRESLASSTSTRPPSTGSRNSLYATGSNSNSNSVSSVFQEGSNSEAMPSSQSTGPSKTYCKKPPIPAPRPRPSTNSDSETFEYKSKRHSRALTPPAQPHSALEDLQDKAFYEQEEITTATTRKPPTPPPKATKPSHSTNSRNVNFQPVLHFKVKSCTCQSPSPGCPGEPPSAPGQKSLSNCNGIDAYLQPISVSGSYSKHLIHPSGSGDPCPHITSSSSGSSTESQIRNVDSMQLNDLEVEVEMQNIETDKPLDHRLSTAIPLPLLPVKDEQKTKRRSKNVFKRFYKSLTSLLLGSLIGARPKRLTLTYNNSPAAGVTDNLSSPSESHSGMRNSAPTRESEPHAHVESKSSSTSTSSGPAKVLTVPIPTPTPTPSGFNPTSTSGAFDVDEHYLDLTVDQISPGTPGSDTLEQVREKIRKSISVLCVTSKPETLKRTSSGLLAGIRVVWLNPDSATASASSSGDDRFKPEPGTVRWIGKIRDSCWAGIEFDNPIGNSSGLYGYGDGLKAQLFECKLGYGRFVHVEEVMLYSEYYENQGSGIICMICRDDFVQPEEPVPVPAGRSQTGTSEVGNDTNKSKEQSPGPDALKMIATKCGHLFHYGCLDKWFNVNQKSRTNCPHCSKEISRQDTIRIFPAHIN